MELPLRSISRAISLGARPMSVELPIDPLVIATSTILMAMTGTASAAEIKILAGSAIEIVMSELIPAFEQGSGHKVTHDFDGAIGQMTARVLNGEAADVVIISGPQI